MNDASARVRRAVPVDRDPVLELWCLLAQEGERADPRYRMRGESQEAGGALVDGWFAPSSPSVVWVAETNRVVGFVTVRPAEPHPLLERQRTFLVTDAVVELSARRRGIGRMLVGAVRAYAERRGAGALEVGSLALDTRAVAFWQAMGFGEWRVTLASPVNRR